MGDDEKQSSIAIAVLAAQADGLRSDAEHEELLAIAQGLATEVPGQVVRARLGEFARGLRSPQTRRAAYDTALAVCRADGELAESEREFLSELARELGLETQQAVESNARADELLSAPLEGGERSPDAGELIRNTALMCAALELLPQGMSSLAILPLQMRMVYRIGKLHGYELDRGHVRDLLATAGVGMASQYLEGFARGLVGGLVGKLSGGFLRGLAGNATGSAFSYATTLALGELASRYYAGGRTLSTSELRATFSDLFQGARKQASEHTDEIRRRASELDVTKVLDMVRG